MLCSEQRHGPVQQRRHDQKTLIAQALGQLPAFGIEPIRVASVDAPSCPELNQPHTSPNPDG
jgi:hypothetical protein